MIDMAYSMARAPTSLVRASLWTATAAPQAVISRPLHRYRLCYPLYRRSHRHHRHRRRHHGSPGRTRSRHRPSHPTLRRFPRHRPSRRLSLISASTLSSRATVAAWLGGVTSLSTTLLLKRCKRASRRTRLNAAAFRGGTNFTGLGGTQTISERQPPEYTVTSTDLPTRGCSLAELARASPHHPRRRTYLLRQALRPLRLLHPLRARLLLHHRQRRRRHRRPCHPLGHAANPMQCDPINRGTFAPTLLPASAGSHSTGESTRLRTMGSSRAASRAAAEIMRPNPSIIGVVSS